MLNKRIGSILVAGMLMVSMVGCNNTNNSVDNQKESTKQEQRVNQHNTTDNSNAKDKKTVKKEYYCDWCGKKTDHGTDDHIATCYDCGREMKAKDMEYNGRSFHCGCVDQVQCHNCGKSIHKDDTVEVDGYIFCNYCYNAGAATWVCENCGRTVPLGEMCECELESNEDLLLCPGCGGSYFENEMIEDTENGIWYCPDCYYDIVNYKMDESDNDSYIEDEEDYDEEYSPYTESEEAEPEQSTESN